MGACGSRDVVTAKSVEAAEQTAEIKERANVETRERKRSFDKLASGLKRIKDQLAESLHMDAEKGSLKKERQQSFEKLHGTGLQAAGGTEFSKAMEKDNAKRGAASPRTGQRNDLLVLVERVERSDPSLSALDLSDHQPFLWLSPAQRLRFLEKIAGGSHLSALALNSLSLTLADIDPIAAAVKSHARLEKLSIERNSLNEVP